MAISTFHKADKAISLQEFIDFVDQNIDMRDTESVISAAPMLEALACNKQLLIDVYNRDLKRYCDGVSGAAYSPSSAVLGSGVAKPFVVRANLWPALDTTTRIKTIETHIFSYDLAHDHNFDFLTANYFGPGYETDLWEYTSSDTVSGVIGEHVELRFLERTQLHAGKQIFYRRCQDIHIQFPPKSFSASINLMSPSNLDIITDQYLFDLASATITGHPGGCPTSRRVNLVEIAGLLGDASTAEILGELAHRHPCQRTRATALAGTINILGPDFQPAGSLLDDRSAHVKGVLARHGFT
jgi:hypothetical protein